MDTAGTDLVKALDEQRKQITEDIIKANDDLSERMHSEGVTTVLDTQENVLSFVIGSVREAMSFSPDGELYFRVDPGTYKILSAELHFFTDNLINNTLPLRVMSDLLQIAGPTQLIVLPPSGKDPTVGLGKDMRELVEA